MPKKKKKHRKRQVPSRQHQREQAEPKMTRMKYIMIGTAAAIFLAVVAIVLFQGLDSGGTTKAEAESKVLSLPNDFAYNKYPVMGDSNAPVKIVEFGDYRCPSCKAFDLSIFPTIKKEFIDTGKASFYFVNFPFLGEGSVRAALAAQYVYHHQPDLYWQYHETLYKHQGSEQTQWATAEQLTLLGVQYVKGIKGTQLLNAIKQQTYIKEVKATKQKAADIGINSAPTIFVNGHEVDKVSTASLKTAIQKAYKKVEKGKN